MLKSHVRPPTVTIYAQTHHIHNLKREIILKYSYGYIFLTSTLSIGRFALIIHQSERQVEFSISLAIIIFAFNYITHLRPTTGPQFPPSYLRRGFCWCKRNRTFNPSSQIVFSSHQLSSNASDAMQFPCAASY